MSRLRGVAMDFFEALYGLCEHGWLTLWTNQDKKTYWFPVMQFRQATTRAYALASNKDVYFGVGLRRQKTQGRGNSGDICAIPGFWVDIDVAGDAHKQKNLPPTTEDAVAFLKSFPLLPTVLVHSGHGLHGYWLFKEPWEFEDDAERQEAARLLRQFQKTIRALAEERGWKVDTTSDLARVLRVPGTFNHKDNPPAKVEILEFDDGRRYNPSDFEPYLREIEEEEEIVEISGPIGPAKLVVDNCKFIQHCRDDAASLSEPEWYAMISNLARTEDGPEVVHLLSKPYPRYNSRETDQKIKHAIEDTGPHTCEYIRNVLGFAGCPEGGCGVKAPVVLAVSPVARAKAQVVDLPQRPQVAFNPEIIGALAILKKQEPSEYARIKQELKGKVNLNDLERAVNSQVAKNQQLRIVEPGTPPEKLANILPDLPFSELRKPYAWTINENGVWTTTNKGPVCACRVPVILTQRLKNIDTGEERVELAFYRDKTWHYITAEHAVAFNRTAIVQLGNKGLPVSTENAKELVRYLTDLEGENLDTLPVKRSTNHLGWVGNCFIPGAQGDIVLDLEEGTVAIAAGYRESGSLEKWVAGISPIRNYPLARFLLAASFAAPLLKIVGQRVFIIHLWGPSRGGKTAALKAALSVWGNPEEIMASFYGTKVGLERLAAFYSDLPLGINERQVAGDRQNFIESLVYLLELGKGKVRGTKKGGLQTFSQWRTVVLSTGEHPLAADSSTAGIKTRAMELYGKVIPDERLAENLHHHVAQYYGTAGPVFIQRLIEKLARDPETFHTDYDVLRDMLWQRASANIGSHIAAVAVIGMADYYASQWVFGLSEDEAYNQTVAMTQAILGMLETAADADDAVRAYDFLMSWYAVNSWAFNNDSPKEKYGIADNECLYLYPTAFEKAMKEGGFNSRRVLKDWAEKGWIKTEKRGGETRHKIRKYDPVLGKMAYFIAVLQNAETEIE